MTIGNGDTNHHGARPEGAPDDEGGFSGRLFVTSAVVVVLVVWGSLYLAFRLWRSHHRDRAAFGAVVLTRAIDPLATVVPPDVPPDDWRQAVAETHAMLGTVTGSNLLDRAQMATLSEWVHRRVAAARPETARAVLAEIWDAMEDQAGPVVTAHHPRPRLLPARRGEGEKGKGQ